MNKYVFPCKHACAYLLCTCVFVRECVGDFNDQSVETIRLTVQHCDFTSFLKRPY